MRRRLLALAAWLLHHGYTALEATLARIARRIEGDVPNGLDWHASLLDAAALEIPELRPALLPRALLADLHELRAFRHFLRHAYAVRLDAVRLERLPSRVRHLRPGLDDALDGVERWLAQLIAAGLAPSA